MSQRNGLDNTPSMCGWDQTFPAKMGVWTDEAERMVGVVGVGKTGRRVWSV
jgi:hypothetical protein